MTLRFISRQCLLLLALTSTTTGLSWATAADSDPVDAVDAEVAKPDAKSEPAAPPRSKPAANNSRSVAKDSAEKKPTAADSVTRDDKGLLRFNFRYQPWVDVLDWFARGADLSLVMDAPPPGTFNYQDQRGYTPAEAIDLLNGVLLTKGYTLVRRDRMLMLVHLEDGIPPNLIPVVEAAELENRGKNEMVTVLFNVQRMTPEEAEQELRKLTGPQGAIVVLPRARQLMVTETAGRLRTIRSVMESIENPGGAHGERLLSVEPKHAHMSEVVNAIRQLLNIPADKTTSADGSLRIAMDPSGRKLLVSGKPNAVSQVEEILQIVDVPSQGGAIEGAPQLEVYNVSAADPAVVLQVMQTLLAGAPDIRLATEPKSGNLIALARPAQHSTIRATLSQLQLGSKQMEVIRLRWVDPQAAATAIGKLYAVEGDATAAANAPKVEAELSTGQLLVRGTPAQVAQIRTLLEKMGETTNGAAIGSTDRGNVRTITLSQRQSRAALEQLEQLWPTMRGNPIKIVTPSAVVPTMEEGRQQPSGAPRGRRPAASTTTPATPQGQPQPAIEANEQATPAPAPEADTRLPAERKVKARLVSQPSESQASTNDREIIHTLHQQLDDPTNKSGQPANSDQAADNGEPAPIIITVGPKGIMIASADKAALDEFEDLLRTVLSRQASNSRGFQTFYLKYAKAKMVGQMLSQIMNATTAAATGTQPGQNQENQFGGFGGGFGGWGRRGWGGGDGDGDGGGDEDRMRRMMMERMAATQSTGITATGTVTVVPDERLNCLLVQANAADLDKIDQLLTVLDQPHSPEDVEVTAAPRIIPVFNTTATEVAEIVKQVYQDRMAGQPNMRDLRQAMRGGGGGGGGGRGGRQQLEALLSQGAGDTQKMSIGVDARSNSLVVSAPEPLFREVEDLVTQLDQVESTDANQTMKVVTLKRSNPLYVQQSLQAIGGDQIQTNGLSSSSNSGNSRNQNNGRGQQFGQFNRGGQQSGQFNRGGGGGGGQNWRQQAFSMQGFGNQQGQGQFQGGQNRGGGNRGQFNQGGGGGGGGRGGR